MPALSFQEWLDKLLDGTKQQTTRPQTSRIKVGDICNIYNQQRRRITEKPMRQLTLSGVRMMRERRYPPHNKCPEYQPYEQSAHFLGKVKITKVYDMCPCDNSARSAWAKADGFSNFGMADKWFTARYGEDWYKQWWTVIRWDGWLERYFEPKE